MRKDAPNDNTLLWLLLCALGIGCYWGLDRQRHDLDACRADIDRIDFALRRDAAQP